MQITLFLLFLFLFQTKISCYQYHASILIKFDVQNFYVRNFVEKNMSEILMKNSANADYRYITYGLYKNILVPRFAMILFLMAEIKLCLEITQHTI